MTKVSDVSQELWNEFRKKWENSTCKKDSLKWNRLEIGVEGNTEIVELEHFHYALPHKRYFRITKKDGEITQVCDVLAKLIKP